MAQRDINTFKATANARYTDNSSGQITAAHSRDTFGDVADSFINVVDYNGLKPTASTGTAIAFDTPRTYGYATAETGNITLNDTGLIEGMVQLLIHNDSSEPTFGSEFKIISGAYAANEDNYIFMLAVKSNLILVTITQEI